MEEIVGARIGTLITNNRQTIIEALERNAVTEFIDRRRMQFMAGMDLGRNWELMATGPTLFCIDAEGKPHLSSKDAILESKMVRHTETMQNAKLLPCPFCGTKAQWFKNGRSVGVECGNQSECPGLAQTDVYDEEHADIAIDRWNMRA